MKKQILFFLNKIAPSVFLVLMSFAQGIFTGFFSMFLFILLYSLIFYYFIINERFFNIFAIVLSGIILDSINDIYLGLSSFIFLAIYAASFYESRYIKTKDFLTTYLFYSLNIVATTLFIFILSLFVNTNFVGTIEFLVITLLIFPVLYNSIKLYRMIAPKSYE